MLQHAWYACGRAALATYAHARLDLDIVRHAPLPQGPKIIAPDHPTTTDPFWLTLLTSEPLHILIAGMCFQMPVLGPILRLGGQVPVVTGRGADALTTAKRLIASGRNVAIFPTGFLTPLDGTAQEARTGAVRLALATGAPLVPVGIAVDRERLRFREYMDEQEPTMGRLYTSGPYAMTVGEHMHLAGDVEDRVRVRALSAALIARIDRLSLESVARMRAVADARPAARRLGWASAER
ncbi:MAG: lysophospholipid acyltransferase family protein [Anaerolineae bacterium]